MKEYQTVLKKYFVFDGRSSRQEYWMFFLFNFIISFAVGFVFGLVGIPQLAVLYSLVVLIPGLAVGVRRLHDVGKSGAWLFIALVPLIGGIWLLVLLATSGKPTPNQYGDVPA